MNRLSFFFLWFVFFLTCNGGYDNSNGDDITPRAEGFNSDINPFNLNDPNTSQFLTNFCTQASSGSVTQETLNTMNRLFKISTILIMIDNHIETKIAQKRRDEQERILTEFKKAKLRYKLTEYGKDKKMLNEKIKQTGKQLKALSKKAIPPENI